MRKILKLSQKFKRNVYTYQTSEQVMKPISNKVHITPEIPHNLSKEDILYFLSPERTKEEDKALYELANRITEHHYGRTIFFRGIIEHSNVCQKDCMYCGIRKHQPGIHRYTMKKEEIIEQALWAFENKYGSICLQSGEFNTEKRLQLIEDVIKEIKEKTSPIPGQGLGIALCLGEVDRSWYQRWYDAGAHRYLLRIVSIYLTKKETSNPELYSKLHPNDEMHRWEHRIKCLDELQDIGYQIGTGIMIQVPGQKLEDLANDILFFKTKNVDMIGIKLLL
jgi:biotin synthase